MCYTKYVGRLPFGSRPYIFVPGVAARGRKKSPEQALDAPQRTFMRRYREKSCNRVDFTPFGRDNQNQTADLLNAMSAIRGQNEYKCNL